MELGDHQHASAHLFIGDAMAHDDKIPRPHISMLISHAKICRGGLTCEEKDLDYERDVEYLTFACQQIQV